MQRFHVVVCTLLAATAAATAGAKEIWEGTWVEIRSEHFVLASALSQKQSIALALQLENFRAAVDLLTGATAVAVEEPIPTKIYVLPRAEKALGFRSGLGGYFDQRMRANYAVMIPAGSYSDEILKHEYTHYLIANRDTRQFPGWLNEGVSEVFSTLRADGSLVEYGRPPEGRVSNLVSLDWISFKSVLDTTPSRMTPRVAAMFYAQSWLLVHYLMVGRGSGDFPADVADYLSRLEAREPPLAAFESAFELEVGSLERRLIDYARNLKYYRLSLQTPFEETALRTREMPVDEVAAQVGLLALLQGNYDDAQEFFEASLAENPDNADALIGIADLNKFAERYEEAAPLYERALALEPNDAEHLLDYAEYLLDRAEVEESTDTRRQLLVEARRQFARSYRIDASNPETLAMNGRTYLFQGEDVAMSLPSLEEAHALLPSQPDIQIVLAQAYVAAGDGARARDLLERLLATSHEDRAEQLEKLLAGLPPLAAESAPAEAGAEPRRNR